MTGLPRTILVVLAVLLAACGPADATPRPARSPQAMPSGPVSLPPSAASPSLASPRSEDDDIAGEPPALALEEVAAGLEQPINIEPTPDVLLLVNERVGRITSLDPATGSTELVLDLTDRVGSDGSEQGLLGLALHPGWPDDRRAYVDYTDLAGDTVLSEFRLTDEPRPPRLDPGSERVLLQVDQPYANHNGGQLAFGPDGLLYMALGDGGSGGDPHGNGQNAQTLLGSILRLDVDVAGGDEAYAIPTDNPFADGRDGAAEVFLYGLRNPWRFSFDRTTGELWIADVGQNAVEEVNRIDPSTQAGANLGWNVMEASHCYEATRCDSDGLTLPVAEYGHEQGCSVTGGYVYRGDAIPDLRGWYLFSDYCTGILFGIRSDVDGVVAPRTLLQTGAQVSAFGEAPDGELYVADIRGGTIYRIVAAP